MGVHFRYILLTLGLLGCYPLTVSDRTYHIKWDKDAEDQKSLYLQSLRETALEQPMNVVVIMADDLGLNEVSAYDGGPVHTPYIDSFAATGVKYTQAYVTAPVCAPSRAGILTGTYQQRYGFDTQPMEYYPANWVEYKGGKKFKGLGDWVVATKPPYPSEWQAMRQGLPPGQVMISEMFSAMGYSTGIVGKWHLGYHPHLRPNARGFKEQFGFYGAFSLYTPEQNTSGYVNYVQPDFSSLHQWNQKRHKTSAIRRNDKVVKEEDYLTFAFADEANRFLTQHKDDPFFLYLPFSAPHVPFQAPQEYYDRYAHVKDSNTRVYRAMISAFDDAVGSVLHTLDSLGLSENTVVFFLSDNGGASYTRATDNGRFKGGKLTLFEGGVRVPFIVRWPGKLEGGRVEETPVSALDIYATLVDQLGIATPSGMKVDGVDLTELQSAKERPIFWKSAQVSGIRYGDWKLLICERDAWIHLYNIRTDQEERYDVRQQQEEVVERLRSVLSEWLNELPPPSWPRIMDRRFMIDGKEYLFPA